MSDETFTDNTDARRFELTVGAHRAWADYRLRDGVLLIPHVEAEIPLLGTGAAGRLMRAVADTARARGLKIAPLCPYADAWMRRNPDTADLRA